MWNIVSQYHFYTSFKLGINNPRYLIQIFTSVSVLTATSLMNAFKKPYYLYRVIVVTVINSRIFMPYGIYLMNFILLASTSLLMWWTKYDTIETQTYWKYDIMVEAFPVREQQQASTRTNKIWMRIYFTWSSGWMLPDIKITRKIKPVEWSTLIIWKI